MTAIVDEERLRTRAQNLGTFNGMDFVLVRLVPAVNPTQAELEVHFHNDQELAAIVGEVTADPSLASSIFTISGGHRIVGGDLTGQVRVSAVAAGTDPDVLVLTVASIGDYSTYTLRLIHANIDPVFSEIPFKFRPGCFTLCAPEWDPAPPAVEDPAIDYLAKDYDSSRHQLIAAMMQRVPGWQPTSEADLDQTLIGLFSAAADELSDYQDRVVTEAFLSRARKRVSLARHARLMDYYIHEGNQASTWLALRLSAAKNGTLPDGMRAWTGETPQPEESAEVFVSTAPARLHSLLSNMHLYTWSGARPALAIGSTSADLRLDSATQLDADVVRDLVRNGEVTHLLVQEWLNPTTGRAAGADPAKRQLLELRRGVDAAETMQDPVTGAWFVRVSWVARDALRANYCFTYDAGTSIVEDVSMFHGNLLRIAHGRPRTIRFHEPGVPLATPDDFHYERPQHKPEGDPTWRPRGVVCRIPDRLAYRETPPGGELSPRSTIRLTVDTDAWDERISLVHSDDGAETGDHFLVETDELGRSIVRFGNGINGRELPPGATVEVRYQSGEGVRGNVGAGSIKGCDRAFDALLDDAVVWNPFDVRGGRGPESRDSIIRSAPEAYRARQLRAITLADYVRRAEEVEGVSRAAARYAWTGSWRTVQVTIDPVGTIELAPDLRRHVFDYLDAVRLIGEDLEIRPPRFVPLEIEVRVCVRADHWPSDVRAEIEQELSDGYTHDGRLAFFHPDRWTFGQTLHASEIEGRLQAIDGVDHVVSISIKRYGVAAPGGKAFVSLRPNEIIRVHNDRDHMELGFIELTLSGGRR